MNEERWLPIPGWEGMYEVSDQGRVRSLNHVVNFSDGRVRKFQGTVRKQFLVKGYQHLTLCRNSRKINYYVHTLVCIAFHGPRPAGLQVRHLNGNELDNRAENLAWGTQSENNLDQVRHGTHPEAKKTRCKSGEHELTFKPDGSGHRWCLPCRQACRRTYYVANRDRLLAAERLRHRNKRAA